MAVTWPRVAVLIACKEYGTLISPISGIDSAHLLMAIAQNESSMGANCGPRHEAVWDVGGTYSADPVQAALLRQYGSAAACSYGPWQIMLYNAPGCTPDELNSQLPLVSRATVAFLSKEIRRWNLSTIEAIGQVWNGGHPGASSPGVQMYCKELQENYEAAEGWLGG